MSKANDLQALSLLRNRIDETLTDQTNIRFRVELFSLHRISGTEGYYKKIYRDNGMYDIEFKCLDNYMMPNFDRLMPGPCV